MSILIKNAYIVNEGLSFKGSIFINNGIIQDIIPYGENEPDCDEMIDVTGCYLIPGIIDDQVHFREPGNTHKGNIESESKAAVLGGVTSFMDMPNNNPPAITINALYKKSEIAKENSVANYSFYLGASNDNINDLIQADKTDICGIKVFMGSSTGNMLVDKEDALNDIFCKSKLLVATHCEEESIVKENLEKALKKFGEEIPFHEHKNIRSRQACIESTKKALALAVKYNTKLHILHISTKEEIELIKEAQLKNPNISAETCVHYLFLESSSYDTLKGKMKCNPSIKDESDRLAIIEAVVAGTISILATDHAPHTKEEKQAGYLLCPSGLPLVQHSLQIMLELHKQGLISISEIVSRMCHGPANIFKIYNRGYIRKGYYADITIFNPSKQDSLSTIRPAYLCAWSPFEGYEFSSSIVHTFVNGVQVVKDGVLTGKKNSMKLQFNYE